MGPCVVSMGADTAVECGVWLKTTAQIWLRVAICYDEFSMHHTAIFWLMYSELNYTEVFLLLNKNAGMLFCLVHNTDCAQYILDQKK